MTWEYVRVPIRYVSGVSENSADLGVYATVEHLTDYTGAGGARNAVDIPVEFYAGCKFNPDSTHPRAS